MWAVTIWLLRERHASNGEGMRRRLSLMSVSYLLAYLYASAYHSREHQFGRRLPLVRNKRYHSATLPRRLTARAITKQHASNLQTSQCMAVSPCANNHYNVSIEMHNSFQKGVVSIERVLSREVSLATLALSKTLCIL
jgi:hypothetical protein